MQQTNGHDTQQAVPSSGGQPKNERDEHSNMRQRSNFNKFLKNFKIKSKNFKFSFFFFK